jgi:hypothetical protein
VAVSDVDHELRFPSPFHSLHNTYYGRPPDLSRVTSWPTRKNHSLYHKPSNVSFITTIDSESLKTMFSATSSPASSIIRAIIAFGIVACASPLHYNMNAATDARHIGASSSSYEPSILRRTPQTERYYATWNPTQLCGQKSSFDTWEESYESLDECCEMKFSWDYDACMASKQQ